MSDTIGDMQANPPTSTSFRQSYFERDRVEADRFEDDRRRRSGMAIALVPLGIAMALIVHYINIVVTIDHADWQYVLHRPNFVNILKLSVAPFIGGGIAMLGAGVVATAVAGREGRYLPLVLTVVMYTLFLPIVVGLLLPANLFLTYTLTGVKQALWAGIGAVVLAAAVFRFIGPNHAAFSVRRTTAVTTGIGLLTVLFIMFGPIGVFELLFNEFRID